MLKNRGWRNSPIIISVIALFFVASCRMDMQDQPKYKAYRASDFFRDDSSMRKPPEGTVARGLLQEDTLLYTGKMPGTAGGGQGASLVPAGGTVNQPADATIFPFPVTEEVMIRGKERYEIYCSVCHGLTGQGDGMVVRRGYRKPPAFTDQRLVDSPVGHYFDVVTNGWGAMPNYADQIPVRDRWSIIAYVRALQRAQGASIATGAPATGNSNINANANANTNANSNGNTARNATPQPAVNRARNQAGGRR
jgi:mono/diheme cytochrome c family protein